jgi:glucose 1-dehydrogenase
VTGASQGIGRAVVERLAGPGASVALAASSNSDRLEAVGEAAAAAGAKVAICTGDLADPSVPASLVAGAVDAFGGLDALVINAGIALAAPLVDADIRDWDRTYAVNVRASWLLGAAAHRHLARSRGSVVVLGSVSGTAPHPGSGAYTSSKAALMMLMRQMAQEWAEDGIRVNGVVPGFVLTPRTETVFSDPVKAKGRLELVPQGRAAQPSEIADAIAFFLGRQSAYCTGQQLIVDGGVADSMLTHDPAWRARRGS